MRKTFILFLNMFLVTNFKNQFYFSTQQFFNVNSVLIFLQHISIKDVNTVPEAVPVWPPVQYISDTGQHRCTVSGLPLFFIFININIYIYIYMYVCMCLCIYIYIIINIKVYHKTFPQFRTSYSWF